MCRIAVRVSSCVWRLTGQTQRLVAAHDATQQEQAYQEKVERGEAGMGERIGGEKKGGLVEEKSLGLNPAASCCVCCVIATRANVC